MGYAKRCLLAVALLALLTSSAFPIAEPQGTSVTPHGADLQGGGGNATFELPIINDSYVLDARLTVTGGASSTQALKRASSLSTIAFSGGVDFLEPNPDMTWYMETPIPSATIDMAAAQDGQYLTTASTLFAYQLYLVDVDPQGLHALTVGWRGHASSSTGPTTLYGASLYVYSNLSRGWQLLSTYGATVADDHPLGSGELLAPWRYVNRTLTGEWKVVVLVISHTGFNSALSTDSLNLTETHRSYARPRLDVGADGSTEWGFGTVAGTGALGYVDSFDTGAREARYSFPPGGGSNSSASVLVPKGASVDHAFLDYVAYPTRGQRSASGDGVASPAGGRSADLSVGGLPGNAHHTNSSVLLSDATKLNVTEARQDRHEPSIGLDLGSATGGYFSWAQTFTPDHSGQLRGVEVYVQSRYGAPGNITCMVTATSPGTGNPPTGPAIGQESVLRGGDVAVGGWNYIPLSGAYLHAGVRYAIVLMARDSAGGMGVDEYRLGFNLTDLYPKGSAFVSQSIDASTPWQSRTFDLAFRTHMDVAIDATDAQALEVASTPGRYIAGRVYFNLSGFAYTGPNWTFNVTNHNAFDVRFNWTAHTDFLLYADSPRIDVGDDGTWDWSGENVSTATGLDLAPAVNAILAQPDWPDMHVDAYGNEFLRVPINVSAATEGAFALRDPAIYYTLAINTSDLSSAINAAKASMAADANGTVRVPANVTSDTAGRFDVLGLQVKYDLPPWALPIDDVEVLEDGAMVGGPLYLDTLAFDDHDNNALNYTVVRDGGDPNVSYKLTAFNALTFSGPVNWSGWATFHVVMRDLRGLENRTNTFRVTVVPVNDAPVIVGLRDMRPPLGLPLAVPLDIVDSDTPLDNITVSSNSSRVTYDAQNRSLVLLYPNGSRPEDVRLTVSDGTNSTIYTVHVTPIPSDTPPVPRLPPRFVITLDGEATLDLSKYVKDRESPSAELTWTINGTPTGFIGVVNQGHVLQVIPVATVPGNYTLRLRVRDPDGNVVDASMVVELSAATRHPPTILRGEGALPLVLSVERGRTLVVDLALNKYWYDQEDYNQPSRVRWEAQSLRPKLFDVSIDSNQRLHIAASDTVGSGYFTLRLYDSDNLASTPESVEVRVVEPGQAGHAWLWWAAAVLVLIVVVGALMVASRGGKEEGPARVRPAKAVAKVPVPAPAPARGEARGGPKAPAAEEPGEPEAPVPARVQDLLVIHESTSLVASLSRGGEYALRPEKSDELVELATLFAQERFEGVKVGTIKAFKFDGTEVLVGKGLNYFIVARCSGNQFDAVATEVKKTIINVDVQLSDRLGRWYPGQKVSELESELKELLEGAAGGPNGT